MEQKQHYASALFNKFPLKLDLQFFADDEGGEDEGGDEDEEQQGEELSLDELLKDPAFKKQYQAKFQDQLKKRMKKFDGIDPDEYRRLKEQAEKEQSDGDKKKSDEDTQLTEREKRIQRAELREKRAAVKEFAAENGHNPKLLARLIDMNAIEMDEDGEPLNLDELFGELEEEFPEYFGQKEEEDTQQSKNKKQQYNPGGQKGNDKKEKDAYEVGVSQYQRLKQLGKIK